MFERFTKEARSAVVTAQQVARDTSSARVDTRHLLIAVIEAPGAAQRALRAAGADPLAVAGETRTALRSAGIDGAALASFGIDLEAVRREADAVFGRGALDRAGRSGGGHVAFAPEAKKTLELSLREAVRLKHKSIEGRHLLLGILRGDSLGRSILLASGVGTEALRTALEQETRAA